MEVEEGGLRADPTEGAGNGVAAEVLGDRGGGHAQADGRTPVGDALLEVACLQSGAGVGILFVSQRVEMIGQIVTEVLDFQAHVVCGF